MYYSGTVFTLSLDHKFIYTFVVLPELVSPAYPDCRDAATRPVRFTPGCFMKQHELVLQVSCYLTCRVCICMSNRFTVKQDLDVIFKAKAFYSPVIFKNIIHSSIYCTYACSCPITLHISQDLADSVVRPTLSSPAAAPWCTGRRRSLPGSERSVPGYGGWRSAHWSG